MNLSVLTLEEYSACREEALSAMGALGYANLQEGDTFEISLADIFRAMFSPLDGPTKLFLRFVSASYIGTTKSDSALQDKLFTFAKSNQTLFKSYRGEYVFEILPTITFSVKGDINAATKPSDLMFTLSSLKATAENFNKMIDDMVGVMLKGKALEIWKGLTTKLKNLIIPAMLKV